MKRSILLIMLTLFTLVLAGCQEKSSRKSSSKDKSTSCTDQAYWTTPGCPGYCQYNPSSSSCGTAAGGTNGCVGNAYWTTPGCPGYCQANPNASGCGGTTGSTVGGTTGGSGVNCQMYPYHQSCYCQSFPWATGCPTGTSSQTVYWGQKYPPNNVPPQGTCGQTYGDSSLYPVRTGTITIAGDATTSVEYSPFHPEAPYYLNTSPMLMSVAQAKKFFITDSLLQLRIKVKPEPESQGTTNLCYGRTTDNWIPGYTKLQYYVKIYGVSSSNTVTYLGTKGPYITGVNSCSEVIDLSTYKEQSPSGVIITIDNVKANKGSGTGCTNWWSNGFANCNSFVNVRSSECWSMDIEVAADGTKVFTP